MKINNLRYKYIAIIGIVLYSSFFILLLNTKNGTGDSGDSLMHFLYAKYAPFQHELFFNHWAKPFFVLIAAPFSQFGFKGIQILNMFFALLSAFYTYKICQKLHYNSPWIAMFVVVSSPINCQLTLSGLTEPMFGFLLLFSFYYLEKALFLSLILISFLPFVRSEGIIICCTVLVYLLLLKKYKYIPLLLIGHIVYSILGYKYYQDVFWVFMKIPYLGFHSNYGDGNLIHFVKNMYHIIGVSNTFLLILSVFYFGKQLITLPKKDFFNSFSSLELLIFSTTLLFFLFHTVAWAFGWFNSFGLLRVLIPIIPFFGILIHRWINNLGLKSNYIFLFMFFTVLVTYYEQYCFETEKYELDNSQKNAMEVYKYLNINKKLATKIYCSIPFLKVLLDRNPFVDQDSKVDLISSKIKVNELFVWDNWYSPVDEKIFDSSLLNNVSYRLLRTYTIHESELKIYQKIK